MCFKCTVCNMILNMKNYKGFNKMPYCNACVVVHAVLSSILASVNGVIVVALVAEVV